MGTLDPSPCLKFTAVEWYFLKLSLLATPKPSPCVTSGLSPERLYARRYKYLQTAPIPMLPGRHAKLQRSYTGAISRPVVSIPSGFSLTVTDANSSSRDVGLVHNLSPLLPSSSATTFPRILL